MKLPTINNCDIKNKIVLLRVDINSPVKNNRVIMNDRIVEAANTIRILKSKKAKVVVLAHQSRPEKEDFTSLKQHANLLNKYVKIKFVDDIIGEKARDVINGLNPREAVLLENVRYLKEEFETSKNNKFVKKLSSLCDFYVNDAFSVSHREQASVTGFPKVMKSCFGPNIEKELKSLEKIKMKNVLYILGGAKAEENTLFLQKGKKIIVGGMFGQLCMLASGFKFGKHEKFLDKSGFSELKKKIKGLSLITPLDFAVKEKENNNRKELQLCDFPNDYEIFDIGEKTIEIFKKEIKKARAVFMKGPCGYIEDKEFQKGTKEVLKAIIESNCFSVIGGGHLSTAIRELKLNKKKFNHISLSGGALAEYVAGKKLPGVEVILNSKK